MDETKLVAAITALLTVGVLLLNLGADLIKTGDYPNGVIFIVIGAALILTGAFLTTTLTKTIAEKHMKLLALRELGKNCC